MVNILAFTGRSYAGKTRCSSLVVEIDPRFVRMSFSEPAKQEYCEALRLSREDFDYPNNYNKYKSTFLSYIEARKEEDAISLFKELAQYDYVVLDDLKFIEELKLVVENKGVIYKVAANPEVRRERGWKPNEDIDSHISETELDISAYSINCLGGGGVIYNNEYDSDVKLRGEVYQILSRHFA